LRFDFGFASGGESFVEGSEDSSFSLDEDSEDEGMKTSSTLPLEVIFVRSNPSAATGTNEFVLSVAMMMLEISNSLGLNKLSSCEMFEEVASLNKVTCQNKNRRVIVTKFVCTPYLPSRIGIISHGEAISTLRSQSTNRYLVLQHVNVTEFITKRSPRINTKFEILSFRQFNPHATLANTLDPMNEVLDALLFII
jgi:hypothetical protein